MATPTRPPPPRPGASPPAPRKGQSDEPPFTVTRLLIAVLLVMLGLMMMLGYGDELLRTEEGGDRLGVVGTAPVERSLTQAATVFAAARGINAIVSVLQSGELSASLGVGGSLAIGEALDPVNDIIERFSVVMLLCTLSLGLQRLAIAVGVDLALPWLVGPGLVLVGLALLGPAAWRRRAGALGRLMIVIGLIVRVAVPVALWATDQVGEQYVTPRVEVATQQLTELAALGTGLTDISLIDFAGELRQRLDRFGAAATALADATLEIMVAFLFRVILLPLFLLWLAARLLGQATRLRPAGGAVGPGP